MKKTIYWLIIGLLSFSANLLALDKKIEDGSEKINPNQFFLEFANKYTAAINNKNTKAYTDLMSPLSLKCFKETKHPEYYQAEFQKWFRANIKSLKEFRKYTTYDHKFHELMKYPEIPTHIAVFDSEEQSGIRTFKGWQSVEIVEMKGQYLLAYRCM